MSRNGPPDGEIAVYARENITCRDCGAKPGFACVEQAEAWRTVCKARFRDAAAEFAPWWKDANGRGAGDGPLSVRIRSSRLKDHSVPAPRRL